MVLVFWMQELKACTELYFHMALLKMYKANISGEWDV